MSVCGYLCGYVFVIKFNFGVFLFFIYENLFGTMHWTLNKSRTRAAHQFLLSLDRTGVSLAAGVICYVQKEIKA